MSATSARQGVSGRECVLDTETTGTKPEEGHRVVEIAAVEILDGMPTGREYHAYIDPQRDVPDEVVAVHGLTREFLRGKPKFAEVADEFLAFIGAAPLVAHNASFDIGFINAELARQRRKPLTNRYIDTVALAKRSLPAGAKVSLDALCRRYKIDLSSREKHGALVDCHLLARVYLELMGGRERRFHLAAHGEGAAVGLAERPFRPARPLGEPSADDLARHGAFVGGLKAPLWLAEPAATA